MPRINGWKRAWLAALLYLATADASRAQTFTTLVNFDGTNGASPGSMSFIQGADGGVYGTTSYGGTNLSGTMIRLSVIGDETVLYSFCAQPNCADGENPGYSAGSAGLLLDTDGHFYGTTPEGGDPGCPYGGGCGTVFKVSPNGTMTTFHVFEGFDGARAEAAPVQSTGGSLYGVTPNGGNGDSGTVFKITTTGKLTTLHYFCAHQPRCKDGYYPGGLILATDGNFYGTTLLGGVNGGYYEGGTVFRITPAGKLTTLYSFCARLHCEDGSRPSSGLVQAADGNFYGTTAAGGIHSADCRDSDSYGCGTIFKITPAGDLTTLYAFCAQPSCADGKRPEAILIQGTDGNLYGTTFEGGNGSACNQTGSCGTVFKITPAGVLTVLHSFCSQTGCSDGSLSYGGLFQSTNGVFYGTTQGGGILNAGTVFSLDMGLQPFVTQIPGYGRVTTVNGILGQGFTGTTNVSFDGATASFTVISDTFLKATVPAGATTGFVTVTTPSGTLTSNKPFRVTPQLLTFDPPSGPVGTQVTITGVSLTQTQGVGFGNRVPAEFTVNSDTQVTATVPQGAKTGKIGIETEGGIAISAGTFTVRP